MKTPGVKSTLFDPELWAITFVILFVLAVASSIGYLLYYAARYYLLVRAGADGIVAFLAMVGVT